MKKFADILFLVLFSAIISFFAVSIFVLPKQDFSTKENRSLQALPMLSLDSLTDGRYFKDIHTYYNDHILFRDKLTALYAVSELALGKMQTNGVIRGKDGILTAIPEYSKYNNDKAEKIYEFLMDNQDAHLYAVPRSVDVFKNSLPSVYNTEQKDTALEFLGSKKLESFFEMAKKAEQCSDFYYKTDHHWTTHGAYFAYTQLCEEMGITPQRLEYFSLTDISDNFYGTSYSKSSLPRFLCTPDTITLYRYENDNDFNIFNHETKTSAEGFYDLSCLESSEQYKIFMGGNYSHISISLDSAEKRPRLLLIKDSYANSLLPFLALHFDIEMVDPRYCAGAYIEKLYASESFDKVLILMSIDTIFI